MRLFIAIELPEDIIRRLNGLQERLKKELHTGISWTKPENIHLTLKFLGEAGENKLDAVQAAVKNACNGIKPFEILVNAIGFFPNMNNPRVVWIGVRADNNSLNIVYDRLEKGLNEIGFEKEKRGFSPHLTLGRIRDMDNRSGFKTAVEGMHGTAIGGFEAQSIILFKSELNPKGAIYTKLYECRLAPHPPKFKTPYERGEK